MKPTKEQTAAALESSIEHWERLASGKRKEGEDVRGEQCALCQWFCSNPSTEPCDGCPVSERTGQPSCTASPWDNADNAKWQFGLDSEEFKAAAQLELEFLISLRKPKEEK